MSEELIKDMAESERPREKAMMYGVESLSDAELMAIIFATGIKGKSVVQLCKEILESKDGHLSKVTKSRLRSCVIHIKALAK